MVDQGAADRRRDRIAHIIVLMMENRSFDHLLGYVQHPDPDYPRLDSIDASCPIDPRRPNEHRVRTTPTATPVLGVDPDHAHQAVMLQMFGRQGTPGVGEPSMDGFIESYRRQIVGGTLHPRRWWQRLLRAALARLETVWRWLRHRPDPAVAHAAEIMECFPEREIPVLAGLVKQFAVMVDWHASVPGETWPNRQFAHAATSHGTANIEPDFYRDDTIFELLERADPARSWGIYHDGVAQVWAYDRLWSGGVEHFHTIDRLHADIRSGQLPSYAFVEPNHGYGRGEGNSQHPSHNTVAGDSFVAGEALIGEIYNSLVASPEVFAKTLFLVTYDEHGGFFDHVPPRAVARPDAFTDRDSGFDFSICGVRVPAVAISPLIPAGTVDTTFYEHASIAATVRRQFAPSANPLNPRDAAAADVLDQLPLLAEPRDDLAPVEINVPRSASGESTGPKALDAFQASLVDLAGAVRVAREHGRLKSLGPPSYVPDPSTRLAADTRVYVPGSPADRVVEDVVADFSQEDEGPDLAGIELGEPSQGG